MSNNSVINPELLTNLVSFNSDLAFPASKNLQRLGQDRTLVVATGQQVGLYISPALALYKALTAIKLASNFENKLGVPVVPIFWLQTEDHDYEEIRTATLLDAQGQINSISLVRQEGKIPVSELTLQAEIDLANQKASKILATFPFGAQAVELLNSCYIPGNNLGLSFAKLMSAILGDRGLVFLDPVKCEVSKFASTVYQSTLNNFSQIAQALRENAVENPQVVLRDNATLFFYRSNEERERLIRNKDGSFSGNNGLCLSQTELEQKIDSEPQRFSASALLRPLIQDSILPTVAYIGGSAEIQYLKQSKVLYPIFGITQPEAIKRPSITILDSKTKQWQEELKLSLEDLNTSNLDKVLAARDLPQNIQPESLSNTAQQKINAIFDELNSAIKIVDPTLHNSSTKAREKSLESVKLLIEKYTKAASLKDQVWSERIKKLTTLVFPNALPQERVISAIYFYARFSNDFVTKVYDALDPEQISKDIELTL